MSQDTSVVDALKQLLDTGDLPSLGPGARPNRKTSAEIEKELTAIFIRHQIKSGRQALIRSLLLLWYDHLDASHSISQEIHNSDGSLVHGIMHRREPDYWNSKYWFNRVGNHPAYPAIASAVGTMLQQQGADDLKRKLTDNGKWNACAFVDACEAATRQRDSRTTKLLQDIQAVEFRILLDYFAH